MAAYVEAWNEGNLDRVTDAYFEGASVYQGGLVLAQDAASRRAFLTDYLDSTRDELAVGTRWECPSLDVVQLGANGVLATARWVFRRSASTRPADSSMGSSSAPSSGFTPGPIRTARRCG
jgi:hypothetical protein